MNGAMLLQHAAGVVEHRETVYGPAETLFAVIAARWLNRTGFAGGSDS